MPRFQRHALTFHYRETGAGLPFVFQHGLGGDVSQPFGLFAPPPGIRLIAFDCRGHGGSDLGPEDQLRLAVFAEDLVGLLDALNLNRVVLGGISMGAAVALRVGAHHPERCLGLVLSRPAWLDSPNPFNVQVFGQITALLRTHGAVEGHRRLVATPEFAELQAKFPDTANSLASQFLKPRAVEVAPLFARIARDDHGTTARDWERITVPTLVLGNRQDPIHPFDYAETLATRIPGAELVELASKSIDAQAHQRQVQSALTTFLGRFPVPEKSPRP